MFGCQEKYGSDFSGNVTLLQHNSYNTLECHNSLGSYLTESNKVLRFEEKISQMREGLADVRTEWERWVCHNKAFPNVFWFIYFYLSFYYQW